MSSNSPLIGVLRFRPKIMGLYEYITHINICFSFLFLRWDCRVHVIKHMQRFKNGDSMTVSDLCNYIKIRREIASDLVLHEGNREKQTIVAIVCTKTSTRAMKKLLL